jgi:prephenate dehydrogenase
MKLVVVGLGLIGGSLALDLRERGFVSRVTGLETDPDHRAQAVSLKLVDEALDSSALGDAPAVETALGSADLVVLAVPVGAISDLLPGILDRIGPAATVTDMGSTKERICLAVRSHPKRAQYVPSHPMAGTENSGPAAALKGLYNRKTAVICEAESCGPDHLRKIELMYERLGMRLVRMGAAEHDLHVAYVSHLSHVSSFVLAGTVLAKERNAATIFDLASGGFESTVRLAKSSPGMWGPIFEQNQDNVVAALDDYIGQLQEFRQALAGRRWDEARRLMTEANRIRPVLADIGARTQSSKTNGKLN